MKVRYIKADGTETVRNNATCPNYGRLAWFAGGPLERLSVLVEAPNGTPTAEK